MMIIINIRLCLLEKREKNLIGKSANKRCGKCEMWKIPYTVECLLSMGYYIDYSHSQVSAFAYNCVLQKLCDRWNKWSIHKIDSFSSIFTSNVGIVSHTNSAMWVIGCPRYFSCTTGAKPILICVLIAWHWIIIVAVYVSASCWILNVESANWKLQLPST